MHIQKRQRQCVIIWKLFYKFEKGVELNVFIYRRETTF